MKIAKLNIDGYIGGSSIQEMFGEDVFNLSKLKKFLDNLESDVTDIHVYINSGGGSVTEGWAIYDKLKASGKNITTIGEGIVGSIATVIYMAGSTRKLHENTKFFIHNPYWLPNSDTPLEGNDLIALGEDLKFEQGKILEFYSKVTGVDSNVIEPLMDKATDLTATQAIEMGFAHSTISEFVNYNHYRLVAMIDVKPKQTNNMNEDKTTILGAIEKLGDKLAKYFKKDIVNMTMKVSNPEGAEVELFIESETDDITGKSAYLVDAEGNQVVAPNGEYKDATGKVIKVVDGVVSEVIMPQENNELEKIKAELEAAKSESENLKAELSEKSNELETVKASMSEINKEFVALKNTIIGSGARFETQGQNFSNSKPVEVNPYIKELANSLKRKK